MYRHLVILLISCMVSACTHLLFHPTRSQQINPEVLGVAYENVYIKTADNILIHGWYLHAETKPRAKVLFFHGNGENISSHVSMVAWMTRQGFDVILVDYRGYGLSQGRTDLKGSIRDVDTTIRYTINEILTEHEKLFVLGHSLGASLSIAALASNDYHGKVNALLSVSAFSDYHDIARDKLSSLWLTWPLQWPLSLTINNDFSPKMMVAKIAPVNLVIMHAEDDHIVPVYHADVLFEHANQPKYIEKVAGDHNQILLQSENQSLLLHYLNRFIDE